MSWIFLQPPRRPTTTTTAATITTIIDTTTITTAITPATSRIKKLLQMSPDLLLAESWN